MKRIKNIIAIILAMALTASTINVTVKAAASDSSKDIVANGEWKGFEWELDEEGSLSIEGEGDFFVNVYPEGGIVYENPEESVPWKEYKNDIKSVKISEGITSIGNGLFKECRALENVELPSSLKKIGEETFANTSCLEFIELPENLEEIGRTGFFASGLKYIKIPKKVSVFNTFVFASSKLQKIDVMCGNVEFIGYGAFQGCEKLKEVNFQGRVSYVDEKAFRNCTQLVSLGHLSEMEYIGKEAFSYANEDIVKAVKGLKVVEAGGLSVANPSDYMYYDYDLEIPYGVERLESGSYRFYNYRKITMPETIKIMNDYNIRTHDNISVKTSKNIEINTRNYRISGYDTINNIQVSEVKPTKDIIVTNNSEQDVKVGDYVVKPGEKYMAKKLEYPEITYNPIIEFDYDKLVYEGDAGKDSKWKYNPINKTITVSGRSVVNIAAPTWVNEVEHLVFEEGITDISGSSRDLFFTAFTNIKDVTIPSTMEKFDNRVIWNSKKIEKFIVNDNPKYKVINNSLYYVDENGNLGLQKYANGSDDEEFNIDEIFYSMKQDAFSGSRNLKVIEIPKEVSTITLPIDTGSARTIKILNDSMEFKILEGDIKQTFSVYKNSKTEKLCIKENLKYECIDISGIESISVEKKPNSIWGYINRNVNPEGLILHVKELDGDEYDIDYGYSLSFDTSQLGSIEVLVSYGEATTSYEYEVRDIPEDKMFTAPETKVNIENGNDIEFFFIPKITEKYILERTEGQDIIGQILYMDDTKVPYYPGVLHGVPREDTVELVANNIYLIKISINNSNINEASGKFRLFMADSDIQCNHDYIELGKVEPTCNSNGYTKYGCTICGKIDKEENKDKLPCTYTTFIEHVDPTCVTDGGDKYRCSVCKKVGLINVEPATGHDYIYQIIKPSLYEYGYTEKKCRKCGLCDKFDWTNPLIKDEIINSVEDKNEEYDVEQDNRIINPIKPITPKVKVTKTKKKIKLFIKNYTKNLGYEIKIKVNKKYKKFYPKQNKWSIKRKGIKFIKIRSFIIDEKKKKYSAFKTIKI